jgi:hypothetical protein
MIVNDISAVKNDANLRTYRGYCYIKATEDLLTDLDGKTTEFLMPRPTC